MKEKRKIVERGIGYTIYFCEGLFFVDFYRNKCDGFETLAGARESVYYRELREEKK